MENFSSQSTLEILPDEILLEVCKYLLSTDVLQSFIGLNHRMTQMITQYYHHISFYRASFLTSDYLCRNILPQIGLHVQSLFIDCDYSGLIDDLFIEYFGKKMSMIFPNLKRIRLDCYDHDKLVTFLDGLHDLNHLIEIHLNSLSNIPTSHQTIVARSLFQANNHRLTSILIDEHSDCLNFDKTDRYLNVLRLRINLTKAMDLLNLFAAIPNVNYLDVVITEKDGYFEFLDETKHFSLVHLIDFRLKSVRRLWTLKELSILFIQLSFVQHLSLFLSTNDRQLIEGNIIYSILPSTIEQFNYAVDYFYESSFDETDEIIASWPLSNPIACYLDDQVLYLHTLSWHFSHIEFFLLRDKNVLCSKNNVPIYDRSAEEVDIWVNRNFTLTKLLLILSQCWRAKIITIYVINKDEILKEEQKLAEFRPSKLPRLNQLSLFKSVPSNLEFFSFILNIAPNLFRLDLPFNWLWKILENQQIHHLLGQRITSLCIYKNAIRTSTITIQEKHIPIIASVFSRIHDLNIDVMHLKSSTTMISNRDVPQDILVENLSAESLEEKHQAVLPLSSESMLLYLLTQFKLHRLTALYVEGEFLEEIKTNTEQWLRENTILCEQKFKAGFYQEWDQVRIWM